jgi:hypothetical protein
MNSIFLVVSTVGATAAIFVLNFLIYIFRKWMEVRRLKQTGTEATARILEAQVINEAGRYLPFVRLKLEVNTGERNSFITETDSLFSVPELPELIAGNSVRIRYNARDITQAQIVKPAAGFKSKEELSWKLATENSQLVLAS